MAVTDLRIFQVDETYMRIEAHGPLLYELKDHFSFEAKNYFFHPKYKAGYWDGRISLFKLNDKKLLKGLLPDLITWCEHNSYSYYIDDKVMEKVSPYKINEAKIIDFYKKIKGPYLPHDSQIDAVKHCINEGRNIILAPTSNGKSYIIHGLCAFYTMQKKKVLIVIDRSQLVEQLRKDMVDEYHSDSIYKVNTIYDKIDPKRCDVFITTWQSVINNDPEWFQQFDILLGDEIHKFKSKSLIDLIALCGHIGVRHGFTATLDNDSQTDRLTLKGLFGSAYRVATTAELIKSGIVARPLIYAVELTYDDHVKRAVSKLEFADEVKLIELLEERTRLIAKMACKLEGNTLVAFKHEDHGLSLYKAIKDLKLENIGQAQSVGATIKTIVTDHEVENNLFFANNKVKLKNRLDISATIDLMRGSTAVVSLGTFSTGVSIKNINNLIIACQLLSQITIPQLIGRTLRITKTKKTSTIYDIGDNMSWEEKDNTTFKHFKERLAVYANEGFEIKFRKIHLSIKDLPLLTPSNKKAKK